jgi:hypothetical protein
MNQSSIDIVDAISQPQKFRMGHGLPFAQICSISRRNMFKRKPGAMPAKFPGRIYFPIG